MDAKAPVASGRASPYKANGQVYFVEITNTLMYNIIYMYYLRKARDNGFTDKDRDTVNEIVDKKVYIPCVMKMNKDFYNGLMNFIKT